MDFMGIGTLLSGVGGLFGATRKREKPRDTALEQLRGAFTAADEAGLHRLAVAGSPAGYSPAPSYAAEGLMNAGQAIARYGEYREGRKLARKNEELVDAQIAEVRSRTVLNEANARRALMVPQPGLGGAMPAIARAFDNTARGKERPVSIEPERDMPATQTVTFGDQTGRGLNPEAFEVGISELLTGLAIYGPQWLLDRMGVDFNSNRSGGRQAQGRRPGAKPNEPGYRR